ncbi:MAG TPA: tetratricopeptide repeat protein [Tepidisphaeraceae bacterium]
MTSAMDRRSSKGTEAMANRRTHARLAQLWQFPLLVVSVALFGVAAYLFINPQPGLTIDQKIDAARTFLDQQRPEAALAQLNKILATEKLDTVHQGKIHLMLAESLEMGQQQLKISIPINHARIIEQTRLAVGNGAPLDAPAYRRLGASYEALNKVPEAVDNYRKAIAMDPAYTLWLQRKIINLQLDADDVAPAEASLDEYLKNPKLTDAERAWALGQKSQLLIDDGKFVDARIMLDDALKYASDVIAQGEVNYELGYCAYKLNDPDEAERYLRVARDQLQAKHPLDGDACFLLGKIYQDRNDPTTANSFYQIVLVSHIDAKVAPLARLGRALCRITLKQEDAGLTDLHDLMDEMQKRPSAAKLKEPVLAGLRQASQMLATRENYQGAIEVLAYEQTLEPEPSPSFFERLGTVFERRADQLEEAVAAAAPADQIRRTQQAREMRTRAGDAFIAYSQKLTLVDDKAYGDAMWHGIDLYDRASAVQYVISALELFVAERPDDRLAPDALLRLGRAYQAAGFFDKAISAFQRNQFRYPQSLAASKSAVPLAQAYIAKGPDYYNKAESVLLSVVDNNKLLDPDAEEFKQALFDLGQLYYRTSRFEEAVARLEEFTQRYPNDDRMGQLLFLMADSYRKSASLLDARLASSNNETNGATAVADLAEAVTAKRDRLGKAKGLYDRVIDMYRAHDPTQDVDKLYFKLAHFYRADCMYDLGDYAEAIKLYDTAAFRYQEDPSALAAYVQIVNAYCAMGKMDEAKTANERAKWLLRRMPPEAFNDGSFSMPKAYWEQWLKWTSQSGMW